MAVLTAALSGAIQQIAKNLQLIIFNKMGMMASSVCQLGSWVRVRHRAPQHCVEKKSMSLL